MKNILFINQVTTPYSPKSDAALWGETRPEEIQAKKRQIRTFMPLWGNISERKGQLHEVIRMSGEEIPIYGQDYQLLIKVASVPVTRLQVYFMDNADLFTKRLLETDAEGNDYPDNGERAVFYARSVIEMVKKLHWTPDVIICQGWISSLIPFYIRTHYKNEPCFLNSKIVLNMMGTQMKKGFGKDMHCKITFGNITEEDVAPYKDDFDVMEMAKIAIDHSDAVIISSKNVDPAHLTYAQGKGLKILDDTENKNATAMLDMVENL